MTIKELTSKLTVEFKEFSKDYNLNEYSYEDISDEYAMDYFGDEHQACLFLNSLDTTDVVEIIDDMTRFYENPITVMDWLCEPQELANEIIGFVIRNYVI